MKIDCHNHSEFSHDADFSVLDMAMRAIDEGVSVFAITDHCDTIYKEERYLKKRIQNSIMDIKQARKLSNIKLLCGVELGQPLMDEEFSRDILAIKGLDIVIGSIHETKPRMDPCYLNMDDISQEYVKEELSCYYNSLLEMVNSNMIDVLGHITYPYRYINKAAKKKSIAIDYKIYDEVAIQILSTIINTGKSLELNFTSLSLSQEDILLNLHYFKMYKNLGGEYVTTGSDAHSPKFIGRGSSIGYEMLKELDFKYLTYFENRKPVVVKI